MPTTKPIPTDDRGLEAAREYAFRLGLTLNEEHVRWVIEAFLEAHDAHIERNRISSSSVETRIISPWGVQS